MFLAGRLFAIVSIILSVGPAYAGPIIQVDQQNLTADTWQSRSSGSESPNRYGQTFTPAFTGIDVFEFFAGLGGTATDWQISIRDVNTGIHLGTSLKVNGVFAAGAAVPFVFASTISLTPGNLYLAEILFPTAGFGFEINVNHDAYSGGSVVPFVNSGNGVYDFKFREGLIVPEPSTFLLVGLGLGVVGLVSRRQRHYNK